ncbi:hypothetical protein LMTR13_07835 [Bradyrhizobium icense]|uniref:Uncharacterized protein n=1 Tax=Bradyrhizobium icense TaxID=1274631 RepID=A0A1B1UBF8_9BRAD|nr:hypothetical protein LMTR13_07835 [Bradyrhizobium icense]
MKKRHINNQMLLIITKRLTIPKLIRSLLIKSRTHSQIQHITRKTLIILQTTRNVTTQRSKPLTLSIILRRSLRPQSIKVALSELESSHGQSSRLTQTI